MSQFKDIYCSCHKKRGRIISLLHLYINCSVKVTEQQIERDLNRNVQEFEFLKVLYVHVYFIDKSLRRLISLFS
jgi:hypothetical protein